MSLTRPLPGEYAEGYAPYFTDATNGDVLAQLQSQLDEVAALFSGLSEAQGAFRYAPGKWSLKDLLQHLSDGERIFAYRCLCVGRGDATPLPGFDENAYAAVSGAEARTLADLVSDWRAARGASLALFQSLPDAAWMNRGTTNGRAITTRCIPYIMAGHAAHHLAVIRERYLPALK
jgi:hypothetical protein